ncbi:MAG: putative dehydrogenase [Verrucomicrobiales bacterium]|nr:putative dehydrogenase [Verrucomicrobiales bacterium]
MNNSISRRRFLAGSAIATAAFYIGRSSSFGQGKSANDKLNLGVIGTHNRAGSNIKGVQGQNIVAICDIDDNFLSATGKTFPEAKRYSDFRKLLEQKNLDGVVISTTDHTHAFATAAALKLGLHVYCEKPLTHDIHETRVITKLAAANKKLATQMGTQIHATNNYRRVVELIQSGAIGSVSEVHIWLEKSRVGGKPAAASPVPKSLHWDLWMGPAPERPYNSDYHARNWRAYWNFGSGTLGDMGCHYLDLPFWALNLQVPTAIEAKGPPIDAEITPPWIVAHYDFAARGKSPAVKLTWRDGCEAGIGGTKPDFVTSGKVPDWRNGVLFIGDKGMLVADYGKYKLLPDNKFVGFTPPAESIPNSIGHYEEWFEGCKHGTPTSCNFGYGALLTETVQLGNVAFRTGKKIEWDAAAMKAKNAPEAANFLQRDYRKGWTL